MVEWRSFRPSDFEYDYGSDKLARHGVELDEAVECFFNGFEVRKNKRFGDRFLMIGSTLDGRRLKIVFQLKPGRIVRIITGWPL